jgi:hypothetical protein
MKSFLFKTLRFCFFALVVLATLGALLLAEENYRGKYGWERYCREKEAKGERLDYKGLIPAPVPDNQNFAMTPLLRPLFANQADYIGKLEKRFQLGSERPDAPRPSLGDRHQGKRVDFEGWKAFLGGKDVLAALGPFEGDLREISAAVRRPYSRFPLQLEQGFACVLPHLGPLRKIEQLYELRACAELRQGQAEEAAADVESLLRLANATKDEPALISLLVRVSGFHIGLQPVWEGLADHRWSEPQLAEIQRSLSGQDLVAQLKLALRGERAGYNATLLQVVANPEILAKIAGFPPHQNPVLEHVPRGLIYQNLVAYNRVFDGLNLPSERASLRACAERYREEETRLKLGSRLGNSSIPNPKTFLVAMSLPAYGPAFQRTLYTQVCLDEASTACALERYWLANGRYPDSLGALVPTYLAEVTADAAASGKPLVYKRKADGGFLLYSVGWNRVDDGGKRVSKPKSTSLDLNQGDWVW